MTAYLWVGILAGLVGVAAVLSRYREVPLIVLKDWSAWIHIGTNAAVGEDVWSQAVETLKNESHRRAYVMLDG